MDIMDTIILEENPFQGEKPEEVRLFNLDGTPANEG